MFYLSTERRNCEGVRQSSGTQVQDRYNLERGHRLLRVSIQRLITFYDRMWLLRRVVSRRLHRHNWERVEVHQKVLLRSLPRSRSDPANCFQRRPNSTSSTVSFVVERQRFAEEEEGQKRDTLWELRRVPVESNGEERQMWEAADLLSDEEERKED